MVGAEDGSSLPGVRFTAALPGVFALAPDQPARAETGREVFWGALDAPGVAVSDDADGTRTWDVSGSSVRYLTIPVSLNLSASGEVSASMPEVIEGAGRELSGRRIDPEYAGVSREDGSWTIQMEDGTVQITGTGSGSVHRSLTVYYRLDCWNMPSGQVFELPVDIFVNGEERREILLGRVVTDHGVAFADYDRQDSYGGLGGADLPTAKTDHYDPILTEWFGVPESGFDWDEYLYDIAVYKVSPSGQQPYSISGTILPGENGEALGGAYVMDSRRNPEKLLVPFSVTNGSFSVPVDRLVLSEAEGPRYAAVSGNLDGTVDNRSYVLYFLVRWPRLSMPADGIELSASLDLVHTGMDSGRDAGASRTEVLYSGERDPETRIWWGEFSTPEIESAAGLGILRKGRPVSVDLASTFWCLNEARENKADGTYRMEAIIDLVFDWAPRRALSLGDYQLTGYSLSLMDAPGNWSQNNHGVPNVGWREEHLSPPAWAADSTIDIYGCASLTGSDWKLIASVPASEAWASDFDMTLPAMSVVFGDYVRLKAVYDSRFSTILKLGYRLTVRPSAISDPLESVLYLHSWAALAGYGPDGAPDLKANEYPVDDSRMPYWFPSFGTMPLVRSHDMTNSPSGYGVQPDHSNIWVHRNYARISLAAADNAAGMVLGQTLYDAFDTVVGDTVNGNVTYPPSLSPSGSYSRQTRVTDVSEVVYGFSGAVTNMASQPLDLPSRFTWPDLRPCQAPGGPYEALRYRYYVLLPEGFRLNKAPEGVLTDDSSGSDPFLSPLGSLYGVGSGKEVDDSQPDTPVSVVTVPGISTERNDNSGLISEMYWTADGSVRLVSETKADGRRLYVFEREVDPNNLSDWNAARCPMYVWGGYNVSYFWGRGMSLSMVPKDGAGRLREGYYETDFWCQYLDAGGEPFSFDGFVVSDDKADVLGSILGEDVSGTVVHASAGFHNASRYGRTMGSIGVKAADSPDYGDEAEVLPGDGYAYELSYFVNDGAAKDVVLWWNKEEHACSEAGTSEWAGTVLGVDTMGTGAEVYVRTEPFDAGEYAGRASIAWLSDPLSQWTQVDPGVYSGWADVSAVAFAFPGRTFFSAEGAAATVRIRMTVPDAETFPLTAGSAEYEAHAELLVSDSHISEGQDPNPACLSTAPVRVMVKVLRLVSEMPETGGKGTGAAFFLGLACLVLAAWYIVRKKVAA